MADSEDVRAISLRLPGTTEQPHHGFPSFRVQGKVFASLPDPDHANLMCDVPSILEAVAEHPECCEEKWWGGRLTTVRVLLPKASTELLTDLLADAWRNKAPATLH